MEFAGLAGQFLPGRQLPVNRIMKLVVVCVVCNNLLLLLQLLLLLLLLPPPPPSATDTKPSMQQMYHEKGKSKNITHYHQLRPL